MKRAKLTILVLFTLVLLSSSFSVVQVDQQGDIGIGLNISSGTPADAEVVTSSGVGIGLDIQPGTPDEADVQVASDIGIGLDITAGTPDEADVQTVSGIGIGLSFTDVQQSFVQGFGGVSIGLGFSSEGLDLTVDNDLDGETSWRTGGTDCIDSLPTSIQNDCLEAGYTGDAYVYCLAHAADIGSTKPEVCEGLVDNNCNGISDADEVDSFGDPLCGCTTGQKTLCAPDLVGVCAGAQDTCLLGFYDGCTASDYGPNYEDTGDVPGGPDNNVESLCDTLDNDCDGVVDEGCQLTNLLFFAEQDQGKFYGCALPPHDTLDGNLYFELSKNFEFMYVQNLNTLGTFSGDEADITNIGTAEECANFGSFYCDNLVDVPTPLWDDAFKFHDEKPVDTKKDNDDYTVGSDVWPFPHVNTTFAAQPGKVDPATFTDTIMCCPESFCFNGTTCEDSNDYISNPQKPPIFNPPIEGRYGQTGYRCNAIGEWKEVSLKFDFNQDGVGYCNEDSECYANNNCFKHNEWFLDATGTERYCDSGAWTTRVKFIAATMLEYVQTTVTPTPDYVLYCDSITNALGESPIYGINFPTLNREFNDYLGLPVSVGQLDSVCGQGKRCVNSFCVLRLDTVGEDVVVVGTSLNEKLENFPFHEAFEFTDDDYEPADDTEFGNDIIGMYESTASGKLFYHNITDVIFYTADLTAVDFEASGFAIFFDVITNPIESILNLIKGLGSTDIEFKEVLDKAADYNRLYFAQEGSKKVIGTHEIKFNADPNINALQAFISVQYEGFTNNICIAALAEGSTGLNCDDTDDLATPPSPRVQTVSGFNTNTATFNTVWRDLTSKIRLESE